MSVSVHPNSLKHSSGKPIIAAKSPADPSSVITNYQVANTLDISVTWGWYSPGLAPSEQHNTPDILTFLSEHLNVLPSPQGGKYFMEGLYNVTSQHTILELKRALEVLNGNLKPGDVVKGSLIENLLMGIVSAIDVKQMIDSHHFPSLYFGLLHNDVRKSGVHWNAYDNLHAGDR